MRERVNHTAEWEDDVWAKLLNRNQDILVRMQRLRANNLIAEDTVAMATLPSKPPRGDSSRALSVSRALSITAGSGGHEAAAAAATAANAAAAQSRDASPAPSDTGTVNGGQYLPPPPSEAGTIGPSQFPTGPGSDAGSVYAASAAPSAAQTAASADPLPFRPTPYSHTGCPVSLVGGVNVLVDTAM